MYSSISIEIALGWMPQDLSGDKTTLVDSVSGNCLVPSDNKPLPEPMLTQIYVSIRHHNGLTLYVLNCLKKIPGFNIIPWQWDCEALENSSSILITCFLKFLYIIRKGCLLTFESINIYINWSFSINSLWHSDTICWQICVNIGSGNGLLPNSTKP